MPPYGIEILGLVAIAGLIKVSVEAASRKEAFTYGLIYGVITTCTINLWAINVYVLGWLASSWLGIFPALFALVIHKSPRRIWSPLWWSSAWVTIEALRTSLIPFGWNPLSSMTSNLYLLQNAAWGSQYIISFVLALSSSTLAIALMRVGLKTKIFSALLTLMILGILLCFGYLRLENFEKIKGSNQDNIEELPITIMSSKAPFTTTLEGRWGILENHIKRTTEANSPYLNVWPESMGFALLNHQPAWDRIRRLAQTVPGPLLITPSYPDGDKIYNSSILLETQATEAQVYKKRFLTPIGEYIPPFIPDSLVFSRRHYGDQQGHLTMMVTDSAGTRPYRIGVLICLEETISKAAKQSLAQGAEIFISPSNHGDTGVNCALQQERMAQIRAIETCTPLARIGNVGASNVFDPVGREIFRCEGNKMSTVKVPVLKDKSAIFNENYLWLQEVTLWVIVCLFITGLIISLTYKKNY